LVQLALRAFVFKSSVMFLPMPQVCVSLRYAFPRFATRRLASTYSSAYHTVAWMQVPLLSTSLPLQCVVMQLPVNNPLSSPPSPPLLHARYNILARNLQGVDCRSCLSVISLIPPSAAPALVRNPGFCPPSARNIREVGDDAM
jgi:hypothetical protein